MPVADTLEDTTFSSLDRAPLEEELDMEEEEDMYDEEEEDSWRARGRKKLRPGRQVKQPKKKLRRAQRARVLTSWNNSFTMED